MESRKQKILIACDSSRSLLDFRGRLIEALQTSNEVFVCTPKITNSAIRNRLTEMGVTVFENNLESSNVSVWSDLKYILSLYRTIKTVRPDVFFPYAFKPVIYGTLVANWCGIKKLTPMLTGLGYNFTDDTSRRNIIKTITRNLLKLSLSETSKTNLILQNSDDYRTLLNFGILNSRNRTVIVNGSGVDLRHYHYSAPGRSEISFLMVSRLINAKGIREYYEAAKLVRQKYPNAKFRLAGSYDNNIDGISEELYRQICSGEVLEYLGQVNDIRPHIARASVVVLPSYYGEGVPRCLLEAMAMGRAIITTDSVGCRETVTSSSDAANGFLIPIRDASAFASCMEFFLDNPDKILSFGLNGRRLAEEKFDVTKVNQQMLDVIQVV